MLYMYNYFSENEVSVQMHLYLCNKNYNNLERVPDKSSRQLMTQGKEFLSLQLAQILKVPAKVGKRDKLTCLVAERDFGL